jgi:hypothetical protein
MRCRGEQIYTLGVKRSVYLKIALSTFGILMLELALIRWTSQQVRVFAYFNNLTLMAAFLGMGLGVALGTRRPQIQHWTLPSLLLISFFLGLSEKLHIVRLRFPDLSLVLWGGESLPNAGVFIGNVILVLLLFALIVWIFLCAGTIVGALFRQLPPLPAYSADLIGSLAGVIVMTIVSAMGTPPPVWFAIAAAPFLYFSRRWVSIASFAAVLFLTWYSIGTARFSPYYRIDVSREMSYAGRPIQLSVNRDFHQLMQDLSPRGVNRTDVSADDRVMLHAYQRAYSLPFELSNKRESAVIVGAGTGNDVAAAQRAGFKQIVSVDIDPLIMKFGKWAHPERPYDHPGTTRVVNDARAYFEQNSGKRFDVVCFGLLDSHAMFSAMSSLRLENYVYTVDSIRSAWKMVKPGGVLTLSFSTYAGDWISDRLYAVIWEATGVPPVIVVLPMHQARMFIVGRQVSLGRVLDSIPFEKGGPTRAVESIRVPTDDWPFLYIRPGTFPAGYVAIIGGLLIIALAGARMVFGKELFKRGKFDVTLFLMGAAFLLIETRGVVDLSLLFGSTWLVNSSVFAGILLMAFLANLWVQRFRPRRLEPFFFLLFAALVANYFLRPGLLLDMPLWQRGLIGGLENALPVLFAGIIFSTLFSQSPDPSMSLGSNLLGALVGGCLEYLSMFIGLRSLALVALVLYLAVLLTLRRQPLLVNADVAA